MSAADVVLTETNEPLSAGGKLTIRDADNQETFVEQRDVAGIYGTFNIDSAGAWTYVTKSALEELNKNQTVNDNFTIASTLAYILQGGYLQGGYNWDLHVVVGVVAYFDWNSYAKHSNEISYGSRAYGVDAKVGLPVGDWLPYFKPGYGYSTGTRDINLRTVAQNSLNGAVGIEYNFAPRWSAIAEYKRNSFSNRNGSITINNKTFTFGFNYYFDIPLEEKKVEAAPEPEIVIPRPILAPSALPEAPSAP